MTKKIKDKILFCMYFPNFIRDIIFCYFKFGYWDISWRFLKLPIVKKHKKAIIQIGKKFKACSDPKKNSIGVFQKVTIKALFADSKINIGVNVGISGATISGSNITIGNNVLIGSGVLITDSDAHPIHPRDRYDNTKIASIPINIEDDVFIGARAIVLKGVTIGKGSVIGAGSVVSNNIPEMCVVAGNPAKIIKYIEH